MFLVSVNQQPPNYRRKHGILSKRLCPACFDRLHEFGGANIGSIDCLTCAFYGVTLVRREGQRQGVEGSSQLGSVVGVFGPSLGRSSSDLFERAGEMTFKFLRKGFRVLESLVGATKRVGGRGNGKRIINRRRFEWVVGGGFEDVLGQQT